jgi:hypothetical protein
MGAHTDLARTRAVFRWMAANISYDVDLFRRGRARPGSCRNQTAAELLKSRCGVCGCYANLFAELARLCGLNAVKVTGFSRGFGYQPGQSVTDNTHAWIAACVNRQWCLLDPTWGSGHVDEKGAFVRQFNEYYFLVPPAELILSHFPEDAKFQLLPAPVTLKAFEEFVYLAPAFFRMDLRLDSPLKARADVQSDFAVRMRGDNRTQLAAGVWQGGRELPRECSFVQNCAGRIEADAVFPAPGLYAVRVFAKKKGQEGNYGMVMEYSVTAAAGKGEKSGFPEAYEAFHAKMCRLHAPRNRYLKAGTRQAFKLSVPGATRVQVITDKQTQWTSLKRGASFEGEVAVSAGDVTVCGEFPGVKGWACLLKYTGY